MAVNPGEIRGLLTGRSGSFRHPHHYGYVQGCAAPGTLLSWSNAGEFSLKHIYVSRYRVGADGTQGLSIDLSFYHCLHTLHLNRWDAEGCLTVVGNS